MSKIFVTGASGMLGKALTPVLKEKNDVLATDLPDTDICNADLISRKIKDFNPDFIIHLASMTDVDACELNPDEAFRVNSLGTRNVALAARSSQSVMVYVSTGSIYNGSKDTPYTEYDNPDPVSIYGLSKYHGELYLRDIVSRFYIFYTCWLFGGGSEDKKFVPKILNLARREKKLDIVNDKFGSPTYTKDLALVIADFLKTGLFGRYHSANYGCVNRFEVAEEILNIAGINDCKLNPVSSDCFSLPAPRPRMEALRNYNFELIKRKPMRDWKEALGEYITTTLI
ncbi:MAG: dTDP-4-dehydrorhamnose reductase [Candidatus Krumholzibacteriota bacterium]|nr:dTDP-4-dehydrorhamnose reductase [Candidatus Krumholzibacteriota bacterium]